MNGRPIIYIIVMAFIALFIFNSSQSDNSFDENWISRDYILNDFKDLSNHQEELKSLGGNFSATDIFFPEGFSGNKGDEFYVTLQDGQSIVTLKYLLVENGEKNNKKLSYILKDIWENFKPPRQKFETYELQNNSWTKVGK